MELQTFTHVVVGGGSAGCVVAARIVENPRFNVLLIEAGPDCGPLDREIPYGVHDARRVPMKGQSDVFDARIDWNLMVDIPGAHRIMVPQAKIMGGGSSINGGTALRNTKADAAEWVDLGNDSWDFGSLSAAYDALEDDELRETQGVHPIIRTRMEDAGAIQKSFVEGAIASGFVLVRDFNTPQVEGVGASPMCRCGDRRISASNTFIDPIRTRVNFRIMTETQVDRVIFSAKKATGVVLSSGKRIAATQEVIICAGAIFSPAILQRSGVGPFELLNSLRVPTLIDLPVGQNLSDHLCVPIVAKPRDGAYKKDDYSLQMQARWSSSVLPGLTDLQMICFSYLNAQAPDPRVPQRSISGTAVGQLAGIGCNLNKPESRGTVLIRSTHPEDHPVVRPNYLQSRRDQSIAREVVRRGFEVIMSSSMQTVLHAPIELDDPTVQSDSLLDAWIQRQYSTTYHFCGTCRMASRHKQGVVDQSGRVYGVKGLRVCDASVIPTAPAANTMWTSMMFAQRIGSSIRDAQDMGEMSIGCREHPWVAESSP